MCSRSVGDKVVLRPYLYGRQFELVIDHAALKWLMTSKDLTWRLHRWALQLQEYDFAVIYRPGASNVVADALSRAPVRVVTGGRSGATTAGGECQLAEDEICREQTRDRIVANLRMKGKHGDKNVIVCEVIVYVVGVDGRPRVVLPATLWAKVLRENHDSIYACHLRTPQTYARISPNYWWLDMKTTIQKWVQSCRDCGTRKTKVREVIPPLRSQGVGDAGDRWALDVAGPLLMTANGNRYVVAAVDYATRFPVVAAVPSHTAKDIAKIIVEKLVLVYGPMREIVMDGAPELNSAVIEALVDMLQTKKITPVPYRPVLLGLVKRFYRSWKDMVAIFVSEAQDDWDHWLACSAYAYNGARHSSTGYSPNELMMGRRLKALINCCG
ncbi:unnamed protein product [Phytophthora fragariaefolia]|uniref:Unnamed protein product n=1 Tax=Phytophthora fragariaefolia TaxID=1490495 RepID=A0A9W6Y7P2_9STRA|nr:unnamed protein product [Phytophthora fragariaefolia]